MYMYYANWVFYSWMRMNVNACVCINIWEIWWKIVGIPISEYVGRTIFAIVGFINCVRYKPRSYLSLKQKKFRYMSIYTHVCLVGCTLWNDRTTDDVVLVHLARREFIGLCNFFCLFDGEKNILNVWKEMVSNATCVCLSWAKRNGRDHI